mgnify:CR=1 FL=1
MGLRSKGLLLEAFAVFRLGIFDERILAGLFSAPDDVLAAAIQEVLKIFRSLVESDCSTYRGAGSERTLFYVAPRFVENARNLGAALAR